MIKVSVIVPVYNAEKTLQRCIDSLLRQTEQSFEVLLVNDGSTDNSLAICKAYQQKSARVIVIDQVNSGVSVTRNKGIKEANGRYLTFVDSDDFVATDFLQCLCEAIENSGADIGMCNYDTIDANGDHEFCDHNYADGTIFTQHEIETVLYSHIILCDNTTGYYSLWNKIFRRDFINQHRLSLQRDMSFGEDMLFIMDSLLHCQKIIFIRKPLYFYDCTGNGLFNAYRPSLLNDAMRCYQQIVKQTEPYNQCDPLNEGLNFKYYYYINRYMQGIVQNEKHCWSKLCDVFKNATVLKIYRQIAQYKDSVWKRHALDVAERRVLKLISQRQYKIAAFYIWYSLDEQHPLRKIRKNIERIRTIMLEPYCDKAKSLYWSFRVQGGGTFLIAPKTKIIVKRGAKIEITGVLNFNLCWDGRQNQPATLCLEENARLLVQDSFRIYSGAYVSIAKNAELVLGSGFINCNGKVACFEKIEIGEDVKISEDVVIRDSDNHRIIKEGYQTTKPVRIGNHVWIGLRSVILKGVHINDGTIIAAGAVVTKDTGKSELWGGTPAKRIQENVEWR